ncbi:MAG: LuxR family transcriptional regulator [Geobacteraceae bacterium GWC2_53_11]|nr:MAG: LuxR family transcriptional regulator [Geobacteraceae bacterium GWC2_53_11]
MKSLLTSFTSQGYALMRIVVGFLFLWHGFQKLFGFPAGMPAGVPPFITYVAGPIELIGGILIMIGLFTQWAAFITSGQMAFAYWIGHGTNALLPLQNNGELAVLYCFVFLFIATQGGGIWSVDALIHRRKTSG